MLIMVTLMMMMIIFGVPNYSSLATMFNPWEYYNKWPLNNNNNTNNTNTIISTTTTVINEVR